MLMNLSPSRLAALMPATESTGICGRNFSCTFMTNSTARLGSEDLISSMRSSEPMVKPLSRTGVPSAIPLASSMKVCKSAVFWKNPLELVNRKINTARIRNAASPTTPTFNCDQRTFFGSAMV